MTDGTTTMTGDTTTGTPASPEPHQSASPAPAAPAGDDPMTAMLARPGHGASIQAGPGGDYLPGPSKARLALEVLWEELATGTGPHDSAPSQALRTLDAHVRQQEEDHLARTGLTSEYLIIRPANPLHLPGPDDAARITAAIATLAQLGMLYSTDDDE